MRSHGGHHGPDEPIAPLHREVQHQYAREQSKLSEAKSANRIEQSKIPSGAAQLCDATGQVVRVLRMNAGTNTLELSGLPDGLYLLRSGAGMVRVVKQR
jgi:hypothetical protein